jgi:phosphoribosyl-ATP pyrophosphohydrolase
MFEDLIKTINQRRKSKIETSYTKQLISSGLEKCVDKLQEEFDELKEALKNDKTNVAHETADVIYHLLVSLEVANVKFEDVLVELEKRKKLSGIEEKNSRECEVSGLRLKGSVLLIKKLNLLLIKKK